MAVKTDISAMIAAAVADALAGMLPGAPDAPVSPAKKATARKATPRKAAAKLATGCITAGIAWELLGADPAFEPKNPAKGATNAQLWRLNEAGRLTVA
jgi:hypothetical protein